MSASPIAAGATPRACASARRTRLPMPLPTIVRIAAVGSGSWPSSARSALTAAARSSIVSSSVPSRSNAIALTSKMRALTGILRAARSGVRPWGGPAGSRARHRDLRAHPADRRGVIVGPEDRGAGDERVGAGTGDRADVVDLHAAVNLEPDRAAGALHRRVDLEARLRELLERMRDERLSAEPRVDRHDQHEIELVDHVIEPDERRGRIEHEPRLAAAVVDQPD